MVSLQVKINIIILIISIQEELREKYKIEENSKNYIEILKKTINSLRVLAQFYGDFEFNDFINDIIDQFEDKTLKFSRQLFQTFQECEIELKRPKPILSFENLLQN